MDRKTPLFSRPFDEALLRLALIEEMVHEDGWESLDDCFRSTPQALTILDRHATAALRVIKRIEAWEPYIVRLPH